MLIGILAVIAAVLIGTVGKDYLQATNEQLYGRTPTLTIPLSKGNFSDHTFPNFFNLIDFPILKHL